MYIFLEIQALALKVKTRQRFTGKQFKSENCVDDLASNAAASRHHTCPLSSVFYLRWHHSEPTLGLLPQSSSVPACNDSASTSLKGQGWLPYCQQSWSILLVPSGGGEGENIKKTKLNYKKGKGVFLLDLAGSLTYKYFHKFWLLFLWSSRVEGEIILGRWDTI